MGKYIVIAIIVIVLVGGGFYLMKNKSATQQQTAQSSQTTQQTQQNAQPSSMKEQTTTMSPSEGAKSANAVNYTEEGFQPQTITIKVGQTVTWTNKDSDDLWVASNPHPTHTDYPGFDELKGMSTGQTYSFTFTKAGHWGYHNHLNPSQMGVVVVTQ